MRSVYVGMYVCMYIGVWDVMIFDNRANVCVNVQLFICTYEYFKYILCKY